MDLRVPSRRLSALAISGRTGSLSAFPEGWPGKGRAGREDFLRPRAAALAETRADPDGTQHWSPGRQRSQPGSTGVLPARPGKAPAEAWAEGDLVTCGREGRPRPGVCWNVVTCRGKFPSAAGPGTGAGGRAEEGRAWRRRSRRAARAGGSLNFSFGV